MTLFSVQLQEFDVPLLDRAVNRDVLEAHHQAEVLREKQSLVRGERPVLELVLRARAEHRHDPLPLVLLLEICHIIRNLELDHFIPDFPFQIDAVCHLILALLKFR